MPIPFYHPKPRPPAVFEGVPLPQRTANVVSRTIFQWITPILQVGYSRPLELEDLWSLTDDLQCQTNADTLDAYYNQRLPPSRRYGPYRPLAPTESKEDDLKSSRSVASTGAVSTAVDVEKGTSEPDGAVTDDPVEAARKEMAVAEVSLDVNEKVGGLIQDDPATEGLEVPRGIPTENARPDKSSASPKKKGLPEESSPEDKKAPSKADVSRFGRRKAKKIVEGKLAVEDGKVYDMSLIRAMYHTFAVKWWIAVACLVCSTALQTTAPLVTRIIVNQLEIASAYHSAVVAGDANLPEAPKSVGYGIGLAVGLFAMQMGSSVFNAQMMQRASVIGFLARASLIDLISRKSMRLSSKARTELPNGRLVTMVSADASFLDFASPQTVELVVQPLQILIGIALLIYILGYSALVGLLVLVLATPLQGVMFVRMITYRQAQMKVVDTRVRLLSEILNNIRAVKVYAYENFFGEKVSALRREEMAKLRRNGLNRATMTATMSFIPVLSAVLTFIVYGLTGHSLDAATIFSALQYFNILKQPISMLPMIFTSVTDMMVALGRIGVMLRASLAFPLAGSMLTLRSQAEELKHQLKIDPSAELAINMQGEFEYDSVTPPDQSRPMVFGGPRGRGRPARDRGKGKKKQPPAPKKEEGIPFSLRGVNLKIPRGSLVCIVGRVGTGKSTLLTSMINEVKQVSGDVEFGGPVSYVPQQAWVQSGMIRDNITLSATRDEVDDQWLDQVIDACALRPDMNMWPDGDRTLIGERGITLSGGQRQRICLARAAYDRKSEIVLLDDPLSAVDAHVGHHILHRCILDGPFAKKTRVLVTHHLDVLPFADLVLVLDKGANNSGSVIQMGSYNDLRNQPGVFRTLMEEFGSSAEVKEDEGKVPTAKDTEAGAAGGGGKLLLDEERNIGAVPWHTYTYYLQATGAWWKLLMLVAFLCLAQAATVGNSLFLSFWSADEIPGFQQGDYMTLYAALGVASAVFTWSATYSMVLACIRASFKLFNGAWEAVLRSPVGWHDRTPTGRIISRLSKDIEMLDDRLSMVLNNLLTNALSVVGTFALVVYAYPYLGLVFIPLGVCYYLMATYYRQTSREVKRIDSIARSSIYGSFGEQLAGLGVIRAFGQQQVFQRRLQDAVNMEGQAYIITITLQRWLSLRLNLLSYTLSMLIAMFGAIFRDSVSAAKLGVVLTYSLSAASVFSQLVQMFAMVEQEMNNVERITYYVKLPREAQQTLPTDPPENEWPTEGAVEFRGAELRYRPDLPLVLKGLDFTIKPGEKIGIIGRTGAGKSSVAQALMRTVELCGGSILVDGVDTKTLGVGTVRSRIALIPQDAFLFGGSVRDNIDPTGARTDAEIQAAVDLIYRNSTSPHDTFRDKFKLDAPVLNEGNNYSAGERQLLSLLRALVRGCKVLLLDEATSSVDPETDAIIQRIVQTEFSDVTLISIAHRLQTVAYYDRILVLDHGSIVEFDSPLELFDKPDGVFRDLCNTKRISKQDLLRIRADAESAQAKAKTA